MALILPNHTLMRGSGLCGTGQRWTGAVAAILLCAGASVAQADYTVYEEGDTKAVVSLDLVTAGLHNNGAWFGESESFLGVDSDGWMEIGAEPGLTVEFALGNGTAFGGLSGV